MRRAAGLLVAGLLSAAAQAAELRPETAQAFERYIRETETRLEPRTGPSGTFLWADELAERRERVRAGQIMIESRGGDTISVPGGLIHDWTGAVFIPGTTLERTLALVQDYDHSKDFYKPEVIDSRLIERSGNVFKVYLRLRKKKVITVILDSYYDVRYYPLDAARCHSRAYSTRIAEVPPGEDHGFLWRLNSYWRFQERDGGMYVECEAISLTRDIPAGLAWLIEPIVKSLPQESLANTLLKTREALAQRGKATPSPARTTGR